MIYLGNLLECTGEAAAPTLRVQLHRTALVERRARVQLTVPIEHCLAMRH